MDDRPLQRIQRTIDGAVARVDVLFESGNLTVHAVEVTRDDMLRPDFELHPGPYESWDALADAVDAALRKMLA